MCEICVKVQDETPPTGRGAAYDAWHRTDLMMQAWVASLPVDHDIHDMNVEQKILAWADHIDATCIDRVVN